jgi:hypothetical protein
MSNHAGNLGVIGVGWDVLVLAAFSLLVAWLAVKYRLPVDKVEAHLKEPVVEEPIME